ncbi:MAG: radical SAM protein [Clostridiaceae bacterium]|nr:radical SAM protein [Clostridiaceae bacterium]
MKYEGQICRPPMEKSSFMLPVAVGCAYNQCRFCTLFKHLEYRLLPLEAIEADLQRVRDLGGNPAQVFLGDGNAFGMDTSRLLCILEKVFYYFPKCRMVNMDATVTDIHNKSDDELKQLQKAGLRHLYLGIESGLDDVLAFMQKDHDIRQAELDVYRLQNAGLIYDAHIMTGIAGAGRGLENATKLASFFNRTRPERVINFSLFLHSRAPLYKDILSGSFIPASEVENLIEARRLLELIETDSMQYDGFHDKLELRVWGMLPKDRSKMIKKLDNSIEIFRSKEPVFSYIL